MRGKVLALLFGIFRTGITPAHAGKSPQVDTHPHRYGDHPRPCGEKTFRISAAYSSIGSPPPMRGKESNIATPRCILRITPAHAGKSPRPEGRDSTNPDHPRPCGEKGVWRTIRAQMRGSPPPMRGKAVLALAAIRRDRITPAHAGKRGVTLRGGALIADHPRPCGEKSASSREIASRLGSPPPMRGKVLESGQINAQQRITPAHAGKSLTPGASSSSEKDHPRPCGEKIFPCAALCVCKGSPPPMRGKGSLQGVRTETMGITPAHAGKRSPN